MQCKKIDKIIPSLTLTNWSAFTNQPNTDTVEIVSDSANDVQVVTVWGVDANNILRYEEITLTGITAVATTRANWKNIYSVYCGYANGKVSLAAQGTITIREGSGNLGITTITAGNYHSGMLIFNQPGSVFDYELEYGYMYLSTILPVATSTIGIKNLGRCYEKLQASEFPVSFISDNVGCKLQITFFKV